MLCHVERRRDHPAKLPVTWPVGLKAWPRGLRPLRCSLDFARNEGG